MWVQAPRSTSAARVRAVALFVALLAALVVTGAALSRPAHADPVRIRLRGSTRIEARTMRANGKLVVTGNVLDDTGQPVSREPVALTLLGGTRNAADAPNAPAVKFATSGASGAAFESCGDPKGPGVKVERDGSLSLESDDLGAFCARVTLPIERYVARLSTRGSSLYDAASTELAIDLARRTLSLAFDPRPRILSLDDASTTIEALARFEDEGTATPALGLALTLATESGATVAKGTTNASGRVRFSVDAAHGLGPPGRGELRVAFGGNADTAAATFSAEIERHARVELASADAGERSPGVPEEGITVTILASAAGTEAASGSVEAFVGDTLVGAAPVTRGRADVVVTFAAQAGATVTKVRFRYAPDAPWHEAGKELVVAVPIRAPGPLRHLPLVVAGIAVVGWLALGRARRAKAVRVVKQTAPRVRAPQAAIEVVRVARDRSASFTGKVSDAHDGTPVAGARIALERPGFQTIDVLASTFADDAGAFELKAESAREGDVLVAEAPFHAAFRQPAPERGELRVALVLRKRALLDRLVAWARRMGRPFDAKPEATPGHVRRVAGADLQAARWAEAVEKAAYAGAQVDAVTEAEVEALRPRSAGEPAGAARAPIGAGTQATLVGGDNAATEIDPPSGSRGVSPS